MSSNPLEDKPQTEDKGDVAHKVACQLLFLGELCHQVDSQELYCYFSPHALEGLGFYMHYLGNELLLIN